MTTINSVTVEIFDHQTGFIRTYQAILSQGEVPDDVVVDVAVDMIQAEIEESHEGLLEEWDKLVKSNPTIDEIREHLVKFKYPVRLSLSTAQIEL